MEDITNIIAQKIKLGLAKANMKPIDLAKKTGISKSNISNYMSGRYAPKQEGIYAIAQALGVSTNWLMGLENQDKTINVYSSVHAGIPNEMIDNIVDTEELSEELLNSEKFYFGVKVKGDSMLPEYIEGDTLIVEKSSSCESGDDCIVSIGGDEAFLKRIYISPNSLTLQALNSKYPPINFTNDEIIAKNVVIIGIVRELRRKK